MSTITPIVEKAIGEIRSSFPECDIEVEPDGSGGAHITVRDLALGPPYSQEKIWISFQVTFQYPYADVYPHFTCPDLSRVDGQPLGEGIGPGANCRGQPATQLSRRSNKLNPATDTAALKLLKVMQWLRTHP